MRRSTPRAAHALRMTFAWPARHGHGRSTAPSSVATRGSGIGEKFGVMVQTSGMGCATSFLAEFTPMNLQDARLWASGEGLLAALPKAGPLNRNTFLTPKDHEGVCKFAPALLKKLQQQDHSQHFNLGRRHTGGSTSFHRHLQVAQHQGSSIRCGILLKTSTTCQTSVNSHFEWCAWSWILSHACPSLAFEHVSGPRPQRFFRASIYI